MLHVKQLISLSFEDYRLIGSTSRIINIFFQTTGITTFQAFGVFPNQVRTNYCVLFSIHFDTFYTLYNVRAECSWKIRRQSLLHSYVCTFHRNLHMSFLLNADWSTSESLPICHPNSGLRDFWGECSGSCEYWIWHIRFPTPPPPPPRPPNGACWT